MTDNERTITIDLSEPEQDLEPTTSRKAETKKVVKKPLSEERKQELRDQLARARKVKAERKRQTGKGKPKIRIVEEPEEGEEVSEDELVEVPQVLEKKVYVRRSKQVVDPNISKLEEKLEKILKWTEEKERRKAEKESKKPASPTKEPTQQQPQYNPFNARMDNIKRGILQNLF